MAVGLHAMAGALAAQSTTGSPPRAPIIQQRVRLAAEEPVGFHVLVTPDTVFVGQQATYELGVFITESAQQRMRRNPEVVPAELRGVLAYDLGGPQTLPAITQHGERSVPHVLQRALFPLAPGRIEIPASTLSYSLPRSASFFSREETAVLRAEDVVLHVRPLPAEGRPADFSGAVGRISLSASLDATDARVGEPAVLTVRVQGRGNVKMWPRPAVRVRGATLVEAGERVVADTSGQFVQGAKEFDWLLTPDAPGPLSVPRVTYAYFDPYAAEYRVAASDAQQLLVADGDVVSTDADAREREWPALRAESRGPTPRPWRDHPLVWVVAGAAPLWALWRRRARRRAHALAAHIHAAPPARTVVRAEPSSDAERMRQRASELRRRLLEGLAVRLATTGPALVERAAIGQRLRRRGVTRETATEVLTQLDALDVLAWSASDALDAAANVDVARAALAESRVTALLERVSAEAVPVAANRVTPSVAAAPGARDVGERIVGVSTASPRTSAPVRALWWGLLSVTAASVPLQAAPRQTAPRALRAETARVADESGRSRDAFAAARASYDNGQARAAAEAFLAIAARAPRDADAWANAGTAAWRAGDTALAVRAWHRALRLEPEARDVRASLQQLPSGSSAGVAAVPETSVNAGTAVALLAWVLGWGLLGLGRWPGGTDPRTPWAASAVLLGVAMIAAGWQWRQDRQRDGATLQVVHSETPLRVAPGSDANPRGTTATGDVVARLADRVDGARGERWLQVRHADGRDGWLPAAALTPLHAPAVVSREETP